jgi:hypothetical protein
MAQKYDNSVGSRTGHRPRGHSLGARRSVESVLGVLSITNAGVRRPSINGPGLELFDNEFT